MQYYTIEELCDKVNQKIAQNSNDSDITDSRQKQELSVRRIRDYITNKTIVPIKDGRNTYFTDEHVEILYNARMLHIAGATQKYISNVSSMTRSLTGSGDIFAASSSENFSLEKAMPINDISQSYNAKTLYEASNISTQNLNTVSSFNKKFFKTKEEKENVETNNVHKKELFDVIAQIEKNNGYQKHTVSQKVFIPVSYTEYEIEDGVFLKIRNDIDKTKVASLLKKFNNN